MSATSEAFSGYPRTSRSGPPQIPRNSVVVGSPPSRVTLPVRLGYQSSPEIPSRAIVSNPPSSPIPISLMAKRRSRYSVGSSSSMEFLSPRSSVSPSFSSSSPGTSASLASSTFSTPQASADKILSLPEARQRTREALRTNDDMVYLEGPHVYSCCECRAHLSSHDQVISKSFHGRHGRAYLLDECVNVTIGPAENRQLLTGLHSVCDIFCKRCSTLVGWTYKKAYEMSQKYKEGKFIVEKIHLHLEEHSGSSLQDVFERGCRRTWRKRSLSWSTEGPAQSIPDDKSDKMVCEY